MRGNDYQLPTTHYDTNSCQTTPFFVLFEFHSGVWPPPSLAPLRSSFFCTSPQKIGTMADKAVESATAEMSEVRLDENGQPLSKNALKKLSKAEAAAKKKAEKAAAKVSQ